MSWFIIQEAPDLTLTERSKEKQICTLGTISIYSK